MITEKKLQDRATRSTNHGIAALRIAGGLFFLLPGLYKALDPDLFMNMLSATSPALQSHFVVYLVMISEILGGTFLIIGWNVRLAAIPLIIITLVAQTFVVAQDTGSSLQSLSLVMHVMGIGFFVGIVLLGRGSWSIPDKFNVLERIAAKNNKLAEISDWMHSGAGRNAGIAAVRVSTALPFIFAFFLAIGDQSYAQLLSDSAWVRFPLLIVSLLGGIALLSGLHTRQITYLLAALVALHFFVAGLADLAASHIGLINLLFHVLVFIAVLALRKITFGSDLEIEHILSTDKKNIVIVGAGFAGTQAAKRLEKIVTSDYQVVLISEENYMTFNPMLAEVVGASVLPSHVIAPVRRMLRRSRFISGTVTGVDTEKQLISFLSEDAPRTLPYAHLVLSVGARANMELIPGTLEHAFPFKLLGDALVLRNRVITQMEKAEMEEDPERRAWLGHFVVIGGGFSGIELGGAILDFIRASQKHYPNLHDSDLKVSIVHKGELPLPELSPASGRYALKHMSKRGINMMMSTGVNSVDATGVNLASDERIDGGTLISTIGTRPNRLITGLGLPLERGRLQVDASMRVIDSDTIWSVGDCAGVPNTDGAMSPPTAQFAVREGTQVADNIVRAIKGEPLKDFTYKAQGSLATIGHLDGVAEMFGFIRLGGLSGWLAWRGFYLSLMPTFAKKTRIFFEWTWSILFSPDIINLRFTTTADVDKDPDLNADAAIQEIPTAGPST